MALLKKSYNAENTVKTEIRSVEATSVSKTHKIIKSTDADLPSGIEWIGTNGDLQDGVWEVEGVFYAMILTFETTLDQVKESKGQQLIQSAKSAIESISVLDDDFAEQRQIIKDNLTAKQGELLLATTLQDAEAVVL